MNNSNKRPYSHLPQQRTTFIGRETEIADLQQLLAEPACRLLTLVGQGGVGKSRLALAIAETASFRDGVYFVPLQPVAKAAAVLPAIADALRLNLAADMPPLQQIGRFLRDKQLLLILDNLEHLLDCSDDLSDLLAAAPLFKLLVTSRELLNLQEEWLFPVSGLPVPSAHTEADLAAYDAVSLFCDRARRVRPNFALDRDQIAVVQICQLVAGLPLALELAAAWLKSMTCTAIADEIQNNLHFLSSRLRNVPERHRSMQAVFAQSWQMLTHDEQKMYARLSVFRGGFQQEAANRVAGTNLDSLTGFVEKSLLAWEANGRYQMHELLRQFAAEQLSQTPTEETAAYDAHCMYYCGFLFTLQDDVRGKRQRDAFIKIHAELENIRAAWQWAIDHHKVTDIARAEHAFLQFCTAQGFYVEGIEILERAIPALDQPDAGQKQSVTLAALLTQYGWLSIRLGRLEQAKAAVERSREIFAKWQSAPMPGMGTDPLTTLATLANIRGDYKEAERLGVEARRLNEARKDTFNLTLALYALTNAAYAQGEYEAARDYAQQAYEITQKNETRWFRAYVLNDMGMIARALGEYVQARQHFQASYDLRESFGDPEGMALALSQLGTLALLQNKFAEAKDAFLQSITIYQEINDRGGQAICLTGLGRAALAQGETRTACKQLLQALQITTKIRFIPHMLALFNDIGQLLLRTGQTRQGAELLMLVKQHPASDNETKADAERLLAQLKKPITPDVIKLGQQGNDSIDLFAVAAKLMETLSESIETAKLTAALTPQLNPAHVKAASLIDPLSEREIELLRHMAAGLRNREIAAEMTVALSTVKTHINNIYRKLDVTNRVQALARARELHLL